MSGRESQREALRTLGAREVVRTIEEAAGPFDLTLESVDTYTVIGNMMNGGSGMMS